MIFKLSVNTHFCQIDCTVFHRNLEAASIGRQRCQFQVSSVQFAWDVAISLSAFNAGLATQPGDQSNFPSGGNFWQKAQWPQSVRATCHQTEMGMATFVASHFVEWSVLTHVIARIVSRISVSPIDSGVACLDLNCLLSCLLN